MAETATSSRVREPRTIEITINGTPYVVSEREMTGAQLKSSDTFPPVRRSS